MTIPEQLNREQVVRLVLERRREVAVERWRVPDNWALSHDIVRALDHWDQLPDDIEARRQFLTTLAAGENY